MAIQVILKSYLKKLKAQEKTKPIGQRKVIPSVEDMANSVGVSKAAFYEFMNNNNVSGINRNMIDTAITMLRQCGFDTSLNDVLEYVPENPK